MNVLLGTNSGLAVPDLAGLGVRRVNVGSALARAAWAGFIAAAKRIAETGRFDGFEGAASYDELERLFQAELKKGD
jgi:2-methylisocitrate lyase-like PEP mutase family enzyme